MQASTKYSPFYMCYAKKPRLPLNYVDYFPGTPTAEQPKETLMVPEVTQKAQRLAEAVPAALENISHAQEKQRQDYNRKRRYAEGPSQSKPEQIQKGNFVMLRVSRANKLTAKSDCELYRVDGFTNASKHTAILIDNSKPPKRWTEHIKNLSVWKP